MSPTTVLDVWDSHTSINQTIPFCAETSDCLETFHRFILDSSKNVEDELLTRIWCTRNLDVPEKYLNAATAEGATRNLTSGRMVFTKHVCACDVAAGFTGADCMPNTRGIVQTFFVGVVFMWIVYVAAWALMTLSRGQLKTASKKKLASIALMQFMFQLLWISAMNSFPGGQPDLASKNLRVGIGFGATILGRYWFMCSMTGSVCDYIRDGGNDAVIDGRLKLLAKLFRVIPFIMGTCAIVFFFNFDVNAFAWLGALLVSASFVIVMSYSYCLNVLDQRLLRLLPRDIYGSNNVPTSGLCGTGYCGNPRAWGLCGGKLSLRPRKVFALEGIPDESKSLLRTSKELQQMASAQRRWLFVEMLTGCGYCACLIYSDAVLDIASNYVLLLWHLSMTFIPMVGLGRLASLSPVGNMRIFIASLTSRQGQTAYGTGSVVESDVASSDVGTLGS